MALSLVSVSDEGDCDCKEVQARKEGKKEAKKAKEVKGDWSRWIAC